MNASRSLWTLTGYNWYIYIYIYIYNHSKNLYAERIQNLLFLMGKCALKNGNYTEKLNKTFFPDWNVSRFISKFILFIEWIT